VLLIVGTCGCRHQLRHTSWLPTPLNSQGVDTHATDDKASSPRASLSRLITIGTQRQVIASVDLLTLLPIPVKTTSAPDIHVVAPHIDGAGALRLLGLDTGSKAANEARVLSTTPKVPEDVTELTFSAVQDERLDDKRLLSFLRSGQIQQNDEKAYSYLIFEEQLASRISVLLPASMPEALINDVRKNCDKQQIDLVKLGARWKLSASLNPPRPVAVGIVALHAHHSGKMRLTEVPQSRVHIAVTLGWIESLPSPTDYWYSTPPGPTITIDQGRTLLIDALQKADLFPGMEFEMPGAAGVVTPMEALKHTQSTETGQPRFKTDTFPWKSLWCRFLDCSIGTTREFVLLVGRKPAIGSFDPSTRSASEQIKELLTQSEENRSLSESTCYSLLYVYDHHWSDRYQLYDLPTLGTRAAAHLKAARLDGVLQCKQKTANRK
jgi:hypothetical protein